MKESGITNKTQELQAFKKKYQYDKDRLGLEQ